MSRIPDGEADILRELNADAAECERAWGREMTEEEMDEMCESHDCLEDVWEAVMGEAFPDTDTEYPF
jgi:hypothetical protein